MGKKPFLEPQIYIGDEGEWNEASNFSPRAMLDGDKWVIWLTGFDLNRVFKIGIHGKSSWQLTVGNTCWFNLQN